MSTPFNNDQASLGLSQLLVLQGPFPGRDDENPNNDSVSGIPLGAIRTFAGNFTIGATAFAQGQLVPIQQNPALFSILGTTYGGNGTTQFALPDLGGRTMVGAGQGAGLSQHDLGGAYGNDSQSLTLSQLPPSAGGSSTPFDNAQPSLPITYLIDYAGTYPTQDSSAGTVNLIGAIVPFLGNFAPDGYLVADGREVAIADYEALFNLIGTTYGGDGETTFALPDLVGRTPIGTGNGILIGDEIGQELTTVTDANLPSAANQQPIDNHEPSLGISYIIALEGVFPSGDSGPGDNSQYLGEIMAFAGNFAPEGWALANGQTLTIAQNQALFSILGTTYGGNGQTTFALPDLRNHTAVGTGHGVVIGENYGANSFLLTADQISEHTPVLTSLGNFNASTEQVFGTIDSNVTVSDLDLDGLNGGAGNYAGASLTVSRGGGADAQDAFSFGAGGGFTVSGTSVSGSLLNGGAFATYTLSGGTLTITFTSSGAIATTGLVNSVLQHITYANQSDTPPASIPITYLFNDGAASGNQGVIPNGVTPIVSGSDTVAITAVNDAPTATITPASYSATEQGSLTLSGTGLSIADVDGSSGTATISVGEGTLTFNVAGTGASVSGDGTSSATITGTLAQINALLAGDSGALIVYSNGSDAPSASTTLTLSFNDGGNTGTGGSQTASDTATINITAVNDAPAVTILPSYSATEQVALDLKGTMGVSDADSGASSVTVTLSVTTGILNVTAGTSGAGVANSGTSSVTLTGTLAQINALLASDGTSTVSYIDNSDAPAATATLTLAVNDGGATGTGGALTAQDTAVINIAAVNDAPTATITPVSYSATEQTTLNLKATGLSVADTDAGSSVVTGTLSVTNGILNVTAGGSGATVTNSGTSSVTITGTLATINALLGSDASSIVGYINNSDDPPATATLTMSVNDGGATGSGGNQTGQDTAVINITAVNDLPTLSDFGPTVTFGENSVNAGFVALDADVVFNDPEGNFSGGTVVVSGLLAEDRVGIQSVGSGTGQMELNGFDVSYEGVTIGTFSGGSGADLTITLNANATSEAVDALIESLIYANASDTPTATRTLAVTVTDAAGDSNVSATEDFTQQVGANNPFNALSLGSFASPTLADLDGDGDLDLIAGNGGLGFRYFQNNAGTFSTATSPFGTADDWGLYMFGSFADLDGDGDLDAIAGSADWDPQAVHFLLNTGSRTSPAFSDVVLSIQGDGADAPALVDLDNDGDLDLVLGQHDGSVRYFENTGTPASFTFTEKTAGDNPFAAVSVVPDAAPAMVDVDGDGDYDLVLGNGDGSLAYYENTGSASAPQFVLRTGGDSPFTGIDVGSYSVPIVADVDQDGVADMVVGDDGGSLSYFQHVTQAGSQILVTVTAQNDAPVATITPSSYSASDQTALDLKNTGLSVADVDAGAAPVTVTLSVDEGVLNVSAGGSGANVGGSGTGSVTITGTLAQINALLTSDSTSSVAYINSGTSAASATLTLTIDDGGASGTGGALTANDTAIINITAVNDAPTATITPTSYSATEQTLLNLKNNGLSIGDVDAGSASVTVTLSVAEGVLNVTAGTSGAGVTNSGTSSVTITGTVAQINALLNTDGTSAVTYVDNTDTPAASTTLTLLVNDNGNTGTGGALSASDTATINITAVNDAPIATITPPSYSATEQTTLSLKSNGLSVADADSGSSSVTVTLSVTDGILNVTAGTSGANVSNSGTASVGITGTLAQINALLNTDGASTVGYINNSDTPVASTTLTLAIDDGGATGTGGLLTASDTATINVTAVNDQPTATITPTSYAASDQTTLDLKNNGLSVADVDAGSAPVTATLSVDEGVLNVTAGGSGANVGNSGTASVTVTGTLAQINALLNTDSGSSVGYISSGTSATSATLTLAIDDGGASGTGGALTGQDTAAISIGAVNDAPVATITPTTYTATEQTALSLKNNGLSVSDIDAGASPVTVKLSVSEGILNVAAGSSGAGVSDSGTAEVTITGTIAEVNALLNTDGTSAVTYIDNTDAPSASATLQLAINDGGNTGTGGALAASDTATINITAVNDPPALSNVAGTAVYNENAPALVIDSDVTIGDVDSATLASAAVTIAAGLFAGDELGVNGVTAGSSGGVTWSFAGGVLSLTGTATLAAYEALLETVTYRSTSDNPTNFGTNPGRVIVWAVNDGVDNSNTAQTTVSIIASNDAAVLDLDANNSSGATGADYHASYLPGGAAVAVADTDVSIGDPDNTTLQSATIAITNARPSDLLSVIGALPGGIAVDGASTATSLILTGSASLAAYQTALHQVGFSNPLASPDLTARSISVVVNDGTSSSNSATATIDLGSNAKTSFAAPLQWTNASPGNDGTWHIGDFNGDGKDDIFRYVVGQSGADLYLSNGSGFVHDTSWTPAGFGIDGTWHIGDFNGDGKDDIFRYLPLQSGADMFLSNGSKFVSAASWTPAGFGTDGTWHIGDFNGDGNDDIFRYLGATSGADMFLSNGSKFVYDSSWTSALFGADDTWYIGDFNGDGRDDIFRYVPGQSGADMFLSNGSAFVHDTGWTPAGYGADGTWHVGDFNGDGRDDIFRYLGGSSGADMFLSNGSAFVHDASWTQATPGIDGTWHVGDFNGDNSADIMRILASGVDILI